MTVEIKRISSLLNPLNPLSVSHSLMFSLPQTNVSKLNNRQTTSHTQHTHTHCKSLTYSRPFGRKCTTRLAPARCLHDLVWFGSVLLPPPPPPTTTTTAAAHTNTVRSLTQLNKPWNKRQSAMRCAYSGGGSSSSFFLFFIIILCVVVKIHTRTNERTNGLAE